MGAHALRRRHTLLFVAVRAHRASAEFGSSSEDLDGSDNWKDGDGWDDRDNWGNSDDSMYLK